MMDLTYDPFREAEPRTLIRDNLWLGAQPQDIVDYKYVFNFSGAIHYWVPSGTLVVIRPFADSDEIPPLVMLLDMAKQVSECSSRGPTLVHCAAGLNRSALIVALALTYEGMKADKAINLLREKRGQLVLNNKTFENLIKDVIW